MKLSKRPKVLINIQIKKTPRGDGHGSFQNPILDRCQIQIKKTPRGDGHTSRNFYRHNRNIQIKKTPRGDGHRRSFCNNSKRRYNSN